MDAPDYSLGIISFAYGFVALFTIFSNLGIDQAHIKRVSEEINPDQCISTFATLKVLLTGFMSLLLISAVFVWKYLLGRGFESTEHETAVYIMLIYFILWSFTQIFLVTYRARKEIAKAQLPMFFETLGRVVATIFIVINDLGVIALAWTYVFGEICVLLTCFIFFRGYKINFQKPTIEYLKLYASFAIPMAIVVASTKIMTNIDKVLIQFFWSATEGGNYFAVYRLSKFIDMATKAIGMLLFPTISTLYIKKNLNQIKDLAYKAERYLSMIIFPIVFFMIFMSEPIVHIMLSDKFYPAIPILQILPIFALFDALEKPYQMKLLGMNLPHFTRNRILLMVFINIILNLILIPKDIKSLGIPLFGLGAVGAAIATVSAYFIGLIYTRIIIWKVSNITINIRIILHLIAASLMGLIITLLNNYVFQVNRWYELVFFGIIALCIYFLILYILQEFSREDFNLFMDTLNMKKMSKYIKYELLNRNT
jgi:O-antigen/teichoic acid export membrane protein